jgi:hypothetical protein
MIITDTGFLHFIILKILLSNEIEKEDLKFTLCIFLQSHRHYDHQIQMCYSTRH